MMLRLLAVLAFALAASASPALASHHHHHRHHISASHLKKHTHRHRVARHRARGHRFARAQRRPPITTGSPGEPALVKVARATLGETATQLGVRSTLWCMAAVNRWLERIGLRGTGSDEARSALALGPHLHEPVVGALAVMNRRGGGHVGVVSGIDASGNPIIISGNHGHRVGESVYPRRRIIAYVVLPGSSG